MTDAELTRQVAEILGWRDIREAFPSGSVLGCREIDGKICRWLHVPGYPLNNADAISALEQWCVEAPNRSYTIARSPREIRVMLVRDRLSHTETADTLARAICLALVAASEQAEGAKPDA